MGYNYLPGVQVATIDGGLVSRRTPTTKSTLIIGTSGYGAADEVYTVIDRGVSAQEFGFDGTLIKTMEEVAQGKCDNIYLFRMGTKAATLNGIGRVENPVGTPKTANDVGFNVTFGQRSSDVASRYQVYYSAGVLTILLDGNVVYSNDPADPIDTTDCSVTGVAIGGVALKSTSTATDYFSMSIPLSNALISASATTVTAGDSFPALVLSLGLTGVGVTDPCIVYESMLNALQLASIFQISQVIVPDVFMDTPNVAYYVANDPTTAANNPATGTALGWLKTTQDVYGELTFQWAHKTEDSNGTTVVPPVFVNSADRKAQGFSEVSFQYAIGRFCAGQSQNQGGCQGFMQFKPPVDFKPVNLRPWVGFLPTYDSLGHVTAPGRGLCGHPNLVGTTRAKLNPLVGDSTSAFRSAGMFATASTLSSMTFGEIDGSTVKDANGNLVDLGAYLYVCGDQVYSSNAYGTSYQTPIFGIVAGVSAALDEKYGLLNKTLPGTTQIYRLNLAQLDALTQAKVQMLRFKSDATPALLHDVTAAVSTSDYALGVRQKIKFLVTDTIFKVGDQFVGTSSTDGLQMQALNTALTSKFSDLVKRGYLAKYDFVVRTTAADRTIGRYFVDVTFDPPDEVVSIRASVAISR